MQSDADINNDNNFQNFKKIEKIKEEILEESYNKAELSKKDKNLFFKEKKEYKKFFPIFGIIFIIIAILGLYTINYLPWMYIKYNDSNFDEVNSYFYRDFKTEIIHKEILEIMGSKCDNCSSNQNYIGLTTDDFKYSPQYIFYVFFVLILLAIISILYSIINKFFNLSNRLTTLFYSVSAIAAIIIGVVTLILCTKFLGANILLAYNMHYIENIGIYNVGMINLAPLILMCFSFVIIKCSMIAVDFNLKDLKRNKPDNTSKLYSANKYGSNM